jgi:hypothetical protein
MVMAMAMDDSGLSGELVITVGAAVGIENIKGHSLKLYPNPAVNELNVITEAGSTVSIYNSVGVRMDQFEVNSTEYRIDISDYPSGIYFVKNGDAVAKFVK